MRVRRVALLLAMLLAGCSAPTPPGDPVLRSSAPPWPAPRDGLAQIEAAGLEPSRLDDTTGQRRFTLAITIDGTPVPLAAYIGMDRPRALQGPAHTHDDSGLVWLEGRGADTVTLGQFFTLWGVRFDARCLGATCGTLTVNADGRPVADPLALRLASIDDRVRLDVRGA
ncbi:hypothetical protein [Micropruina sp.]|uniref:hypothetical protein n=1 Tax=Micropruina sp. TaxID=2737536 RepID=UPI0039E4E22A